MRLIGTLWKSTESHFWLAEIPDLDLLVQAMSREEIPEMVKDAVELLAFDDRILVDVKLEGDSLVIESDNTQKLDALVKRRQQSALALTKDDNQMLSLEEPDSLCALVNDTQCAK